MFLFFGSGTLTSEFQFGQSESTGSYRSCSTVINGLMMIFGGDSNSDFDNQISVVESCGLRRLGTLPMQFEFGACNTFQSNEGDEEVLLCFAYNGRKDCHR